MTFVKRKQQDRAKGEVLRNRVFTVRGFQFLRHKLQTLGFVKFATGVLRMDATTRKYNI